MAQEVPDRPGPDRGALRRAGHGRLQPRTGRAARQRREGVLSVARRRWVPAADGLVRQGAPLLHRVDRELLAAEPTRALRDLGQIALRVSASRLGVSGLLGATLLAGTACVSSDDI